jgi:hypothetical protein
MFRYLLISDSDASRATAPVDVIVIESVERPSEN